LLLLLIPAALALFPYGLEYGVKRWMQAHGEEGTVVSLENVDFNPLTATLGLYNLKVAVDGEAPLLIPELSLHLSLGPLLRRQVEIGGITIKGVRLLVRRPESQLLHIGGMLLNGASQGPEVVENGAGPVWGFAVKSLQIQDTEIHYRDARLDSQLRIDELVLSRLASYLPDQPAELSFTGALDGAPITIAGDLQPFAAEPSFKGRLGIDGVQLVRYAGFLPPAMQRLEGRYEMASDLRLRYRKEQILSVRQAGAVALKQLELESGTVNLHNEGLAWNGGLQLELPLGQGALTVLAEGRLDVGLLELRGEGLPVVGQQTLTWQGKLELGQESNATQLKLAGALNAAGLAVAQESQSLAVAEIQAPAMALTLNQTQEGLAVEHDGEIALQGIALDSGDAAVERGDLQWRGQTALRQPQGGGLQLESMGSLKASGLALALKAQGLAVACDLVGWRGDLQLGMAEALESLALNGELRMEQLQVDAQEGQVALARFERLLADGVSIEGPEQVAIQRIGISRLLVGQGAQAEDKALLSSEHFAADVIGFSQTQGLTIAGLEPRGLEAIIQRDNQGQWNFERLVSALRQGPAGEAAAAPEGVDAAPQQAALPIRIQKVTLGKGSRILFRDESPDPPFNASIQLERFSLTGLDSTRPEAMSPFELAARVDEKALLNFSGSVAPFAPQLGLVLNGQMEGLPLPPLTSYTGKLLGYSLDSGELNTETTLEIKAGEVQGANSLTIHQLDVSPLSAERMAELSAELSMPLDTALGMLRDKNNTIKLELPLTGALDSIQVDPSDAINQAIGRALKKGATTYLTTALFPFGTMLTIAQIAGEQAAKVRLDPVFFEPGATAIAGKDHEYLAKIATILQERPEINIKLCGRAVEADRLELSARAKAEAAKGGAGKPKADTAVAPIGDEPLMDLASKRASAIEQYLADSHGIKGNRLISCQPLIEKNEPEAKPRAELLL
jgi:hypothetical protein